MYIYFEYTQFKLVELLERCLYHCEYSQCARFAVRNEATGLKMYGARPNSCLSSRTFISTASLFSSTLTGTVCANKLNCSTAPPLIDTFRAFRKT